MGNALSEDLFAWILICFRGNPSSSPAFEVSACLGRPAMVLEGPGAGTGRRFSVLQSERDVNHTLSSGGGDGPKVPLSDSSSEKLPRIVSNRLLKTFSFGAAVKCVMSGYPHVDECLQQVFFDRPCVRQRTEWPGRTFYY
jgi:hypothetical protein